MPKTNFHLVSGLIVLLVSIVLAGCSPSGISSQQDGSEGKLRILSTTSIVGDVVSRVGGAEIDLNVLLPTGSDPHSFDPTPQDIASAVEADLVFANGAGLESFLEELLESAGAQHKVVYVSSGIDLINTGEKEPHQEKEDSTHGHRGENADPHTWTDPNNILVWIDNIKGALAEADPHNSDIYAVNAAQYEIEIRELDAWIREQVAQVPPEERKLVTDHKLYSYFADAYGFEQVGALIPGFSTLAEPTAQELAEIEDAISQFDVKAIFVGKSVNPTLAKRAAEDTGVQLVTLYTGSLSEPGGPADNYIDYIRYNVSAIVDALE